MVRVGQRLRLLYVILLVSCVIQGAFGVFVLRRSRLSSMQARTMFDSASNTLEAARLLVDAASASSSSPSVLADGLDSESSPSSSLIRPVVEGIGVCGSYRYVDVIHPDGERRRYYLRKGSDARQTAQFLSRLSTDAVLHQPIIEATP